MAHLSEPSSTTEAPSVSGVELPAVIVAAAPLPNTGLSVASFSTVESARRFWSRSRPAERRDLVVEEAPLVRRREPLVRRGRELVLLLPADLPLQRGQGGVLPHRQAGARLAVLRDVEPDVARTDLRQGREAAPGVARRVDLHQLAAQLVADRDRRVGRGVGAARDAVLDLAESDLVGDLDDRLETGAARLLEVDRGGLGREPGAEHRLAGQVEVAGVLEHGAGHDLAHPLALEVEPARQAVERSREHLLVGGVAVDGVGAGEGDAVAAEDGHPTGLRVHGPIITRE